MLIPRQFALITLGAVISIASTGTTSKIVQHTTEELLLLREDELGRSDQMIDSNDLSNDIPEWGNVPNYQEQTVQFNEIDGNNFGNEIYPDRIFSEDEVVFLFAKNCNGTTPIMLAIERDNTDAAESLTESGVDINQRLDSDETNLLHFAASSGSVNSIRWLVEKGLNVNSTDEARLWTALHHAVFHGRHGAVEVLLELESCVTCKDKWGFTPLMRAIQRDDTKIAATLLGFGVDVNQRLDSDNTSLLHFAASNGSIQCIRWLIENGLDVNGTDEARQWTPLHHAVYHGKLEAVKVLLELQSCVSCKDKWGFTPLRRAIQRDDVDIASLLVESGADLNQRMDSDNSTLLHFAASNGSFHSIRWLIENGLDVNETDKARQWVPLHHAVFHGKLQAVNVLLELDSCISCRDKWGFTPLMRAIQSDDVDIAEVLLNAGADVNERLESNDINLLHFAATNGSPKCIRLLVASGLNVNTTDVPRKWIPLHHAVFHGQFEAVKALLDLKSCVSCDDKWNFSPLMRAIQRDDLTTAEKLVEFGADVYARLESNSINFLHFAAACGSPKSIKWLVVQKGLNVNATDASRNWIPLHHAVFHGRLEAARVLLELKSCLTCKGKWGFSPIMRAVQRDDVAILAELVESGVDINQPLDSDQINILHFAASNGSPKSIRWLVGRGMDVNKTDVERRWIPLHHAIFHGKFHAVQVLLELKSCVTCEDKWNFSPLMRAVHRDDTTVAKMLVDLGADVYQRLESNSISFLHFAAANGSPGSIRWLVALGLNVNETDEPRKWIPLHHAVFHGKVQAVEALLELKSCVSCKDKWNFTPIIRAVHRDDTATADVLVKSGVDIKERFDTDGITLLHFAAANGSPDSIQWLVRKGLDVNDTDEAKRRVPLHHAALQGKLRSSQVLVSLNSCINCRDLEDSTPLRLALRNNHSHVAAYLRSVDGKE